MISRHLQILLLKFCNIILQIAFMSSIGFDIRRFCFVQLAVVKLCHALKILQVDVF